MSMLVFFGADFIADFIASLHRRATLRIALSCSAVMSCHFHSRHNAAADCDQFVA